MTPVEQDRNDAMSSEDSDLVAAIAGRYAPATLAPTERYALESALWARIERSRRPALFRPMLALVTLVATVLWFARPVTDSDTASMAAAVIDAWEYDVLYSDAADDSAFDWGGTLGLPEDLDDIEMLIGAEGPDEGNGA